MTHRHAASLKVLTQHVICWPKCYIIAFSLRPIAKSKNKLRLDVGIYSATQLPQARMYAKQTSDVTSGL